MLELEVVDFRSILSWNWRLRRGDEESVRQPVRLEPTDPRLSLMTDLYRNLWRVDTDPRHQRRSEEQIIERVGTYLAEEVLPGIGPALLACAPVTVRMTMYRTVPPSCSASHLR